ncbi:hypothetical protein BH10ACT11_BH10ACT11_05040 [soil metagenome]
MFPLIFLLLIVFPIAELYVIIQVGEAIGLLPTLALLVVDGFVGAALARSQGRAVVARFQQAMNEGRVPAKEAFDGAMVAIGGALLLAPGFITDVFGVALLLPPSRAVIRGFAARSAKKRGASVRFGGIGGMPGGGSGRGPQQPPPGWRPGADPFGRRRTPDYDYEGTAQEVTDPPPELDDGVDPTQNGRHDG